MIKRDQKAKTRYLEGYLWTIEQTIEEMKVNNLDVSELEKFYQIKFEELMEIRKEFYNKLGKNNTHLLRI